MFAPPWCAGRRPRVLIVVSVDWFFVSHRLPLARALRDRGCEVSIAGEETDSRERIEREGFPFHALPFVRGGRAPLHEARAVAALVALYRTVRPDVLHHVSVKPIVYGSFAASVVGVPRVINAVSGLGYVFIPREHPSVRDRLLAEAVRSAYGVAFAGRARRVIFQNDDDRAALWPKWLSGDRVRMIPGSGVDLGRFASSPLPEDGAPLVLLPARLLRDKGVREFVEAARTLRAQGVVARFVLVGRLDPDNPAGVPEEEVRRWVDSGAVEWWGHVAPEAMPACYAQARLVVLPSYREGLPLVLAEAGAAGRAVVTTDVPGCRTIVRDQDNGWLVPARDGAALAHAIRDALENPSELRRRSARAREVVEQRFSLDAILAQTLRIYEELLR